MLLLLLLGLVLGALRATNTWDFPTYALIELAALAVLEVDQAVGAWLAASWGDRTAALQERLAFLFRAAVSVIWRLVIVLAVAALTFYPFTKQIRHRLRRAFRLWTEAKTKIPDFLIVWGFFLALAIIYLAAELVEQIRRADLPRLAAEPAAVDRGRWASC